MRSAVQLLFGEESGLTLVELLITMLVASILACLAIPAFAEQPGKARDARAKEVAHSAWEAMEACRLESPFGTYESCNANALRDWEPTLPPNPDLKVNGLKANAFTIIVRAGSSARTFRIKLNAKGVLSFPCTEEGVGGCPAGGLWAKL